MEQFVHLHVHSQYSILDGQSSIEGIVEKAMKDGMPGVALTDHGNMFGIKSLYNEVKKQKQRARARLAELGDGGDAKERANLEQRLKFKPILGCEMYVAHEDKALKRGKQDGGGWHLIVLAKNEQGYHNLLHLVSEAWVDGFYFKPRTDHRSLEKYHEGLIVCSACLAGEVPSAILEGNIEKARKAVEWYKQVWGDDYYLELQRHQVTDPNQRANREVYERQCEVNRVLQDLAEEQGVGLVCTNDCHFLEPQYAEAHDLLICISTAKSKADTDRMLYTKQEWFKTTSEMEAIFSDVPEALSNTVEICNKVEEYSIDHAPIMPEFPIPSEFGTVEELRSRVSQDELYREFTQNEHGEEETSPERGMQKIEQLGGFQKLYRIKLEADYLMSLSLKGAERLYGNPIPADVRERIDFELHVIKTMGFPGYFLIVQDYIRAAREELDVIVGPGRGSAAGSVVAYCLGITQIDPLRYDLLFERFLNPDRISLPDVDVDFDDEGRSRVLDWVTRKYGADNVAHIVTYGTLGVKSALRDCCKSMGISLQESMRLQKAVPLMRLKDDKGQDVKVTIPNARRYVPELRAIDQGHDERLKQMLDYAEVLEGTVRSTGVHACGIIICRDPIADHVPVSTADDKETGQKLRCTQYEGTVIEETGLIKMDFLGLKNLTIIKEALQNIRTDLQKNIDIDHIPLDDRPTFRLFAEARTVGIFQFESAGMQKYLRELKPTRLEDLIAMNALYRPGPMAYIPQFINRKHGREPITYDLPCMERYLRETYGITVYQEQVMLLSREIAGFSRGQSDTLRKAMGKKQKDKLDHLYPQFIEGGKRNGHDPQILQKIWKDWEAFASYAFNKSHATCYAWIAYQTAYLKANYPTQYMAACLSQNLSDLSEITKLMAECHSMGIKTPGPDINESRQKFASAGKNKIRFGLAAVKGIGQYAAQDIVTTRDTGGPYTDIYDFVSRLTAAASNKGVIEALAQAGAFDSLGIEREVFFQKISAGSDDTFTTALCKYAELCRNDTINTQNSLFGGMDEFSITKPPIPKVENKWNSLELLDREKELLGIYISSHPLQSYRAILNHVCNTAVSDISRLRIRENIGLHILMGGIVATVQERVGKTGRAFGIVTLEDFKGKGEIMLFANQWTTYRNYFVQGNALYIEGEITQGDRFHPDRIDFQIRSINFLADVKDSLISRITLNLRLDDLGSEPLNLLIDYAKRHKGKTPVSLRLTDSQSGRSVNLATNLRLKPSSELFDLLEESCQMDYTVN